MLGAMRYAVIGFLALLAVACDTNDYVPYDGLVGKGSFVFGEGVIPRPVTVFYYVPRSARVTSHVLIVLHGNGRDASDMRDEWVAKAEEYRVLVFAPLFDSDQYKGSSGYILGNVFSDAEHPSAADLNPRDEWAFSVIEPLFDEIRARTGVSAERYDVFGHSAGAQFVHRMVMFAPDGRYDRVVSANAGWYTLPDPAIDYPYGLGETPVTGDDYFAVPMTILLGEKDTDPNSSDIRHTPGADAQGENRFERGNYFYDESARLAVERGATFAWTRDTVPGVGHDSAAMGRAAADMLYR